MNLKNYTSTVPAAVSISNIEKYLVEAGASDIRKKYLNNICSSIIFQINVNNLPVLFQLPAKVDACFKCLMEDVKKVQPDTIKIRQEQAERTAWKIISDWVQIQITMIQLDQAELIEVFLPYVYNSHTEKTFFSTLKEGNFKLLTNGYDTNR